MRRIVLVLSGTLVAFGLAETAARLIPSTKPVQETRRLQTSSRFTLDGRGVPRLTPRQRVRSVLTIADSVEFDVSYQTNNLGFVDHDDYTRVPGGRALAVVGDSFTAGVEGGRPWLPKLRDELRQTTPHLEIYNLGTGAAGVRQFADLLDSVASELDFDAIVVLAITDDFYRATWRPETANGGLYLCGKNEPREDCLRRRRIADLIESDAPQRSHPSDRDFSAAAAPAPLTLRELLRQSRLLVMLKSSWDAYGGTRSSLFAENAAALSAIRARFPKLPIDFVQLPQKHEVSAGRYDRDLRSEVEAAGLSYHAALTECPWSLDLFYARDGHPNGRGYEVLSQCVAQLVVFDYASRPMQ